MVYKGNHPQMALIQGCLHDTSPFHHSIIPWQLTAYPSPVALPAAGFQATWSTRIWWRALTSPCWTRSVQSWTSRRRWRKSSRWMKNMKTASRSQGGKVMKGDEITGNPMLFGRIGLRSSKNHKGQVWPKARILPQNNMKWYFLVHGIYMDW